ncbi:tRNA(m5U54)methyltransferase [Cladophialophora carrionii]|uniref:tRNA(M5U54)methyltransferase n=1 Tax=Cladophialophora carrionii TaxID=86049 RepID=A0A1C1C9Z4_9EURO|nr:tRNA(m5U54)methyltransferase [Cladophialophora carrionii]
MQKRENGPSNRGGDRMQKRENGPPKRGGDRMQKRQNGPPNRGGGGGGGGGGVTKRFKEQPGRENTTTGTVEEVLDIEAQSLLAKLRLDESSAGDGEGDSEGDDHHQGIPNGDSHHKDGESERLERPEPQTELDLEIQELSSTGDGLAYAPGKKKDFIYVVPFAVPGDRVLAKTYPQKPDRRRPWTRVDLVKIVSPSPKRKGVTPQCPYFGTCSGCQLQMLPYEEQLAHKKTIVEKAFRHFSNLDPSLVPPVDDTIGSPLEYGYRTKITPHYDGCSRSNPWKQGDQPPPFGFGKKNQNQGKVLDIEQCPIATEILNAGLKIEREKVAQTFWKKRTGTTVLLRESTKREMLPVSRPLEVQHENENENENGDEEGVNPKGTAATTTTEQEKEQDLASLPLEFPGSPSSSSSSSSSSASTSTSSSSSTSSTTTQITYTYQTKHFRDLKTYTSDHRAVTTEHIGPFTFKTQANSFFQNNNSILPTFLAYIRDHILALPPPSPPSSSPSRSPRLSSAQTDPPPIKYLLDAYCGSGLFSIALASRFSSVLGIDIDEASIRCARENATLNASVHKHLRAVSASAGASGGGNSSSSSSSSKESNLGFIASDAQHIFDDVPFPAAQTVCIIDPPRKGASRDFLHQLCAYGPRRVVYVSCNVHTQARDVGMLVAGVGSEVGDGGRTGPQKRWRYEIEKLGGFDFFPQTGHVEGVCFLNRVEDS